MAETLYYARRSMDYGPGAGKPVDRGQVLKLLGMPNDEKLIRLGYVAQAGKNVSIVQCGQCGAEFVTDEAQNSHGRERHKSKAFAKPLNPEDEDKRLERKFSQEDEIAPLDLSKTAASRGVRTSTGR